MKTAYETACEVYLWLKNRDELGKVRFVKVFPGSQMGNPIADTYCAVGIQSMSYNGEFESTLRISLDFYMPVKSGGDNLQGISGKVMEVLLTESPFSVKAAGCGAVSYFHSPESLRQTGYIDVGLYRQREDGKRFGSFYVYEIDRGTGLGEQ